MFLAGIVPLLYRMVIQIIRKHNKIKFYIEPKYLFCQQLLAIFLRKYYMTVRNWNTMLMFCFPIIFIIIGTLIGKALIKQDIPVYFSDKIFSHILIFHNQESVKIFLVTIFVVQGYCFNSSVYITLPVQEREQKLKQNIFNKKPFLIFFQICFKCNGLQEFPLLDWNFLL